MESEAWQHMRERDHTNMLYGRGMYAPPEPEPEVIRSSKKTCIENRQFTETGLENRHPRTRGIKGLNYILEIPPAD